MPDRTPTESVRAALEDLLAGALPTAEALLDHLMTERRALAADDPAALPAIFDTKAELATALEDLEQQRRDLCARELGTAIPAAPVFRALLANSSQDAWDRYCDVLRECREANAVNGRLARARQRHVRRALDVLRGEQLDDPGVYNAGGTAPTVGNSQVLGSA